MGFKQIFRDLNGHEATAADVLRFERLCKALETTPNDALLAVLIALDYYKSMYDEIPSKIRIESESTLANFKLTAEKTATAAFKTSETAHANALAKLADKVAVQVSTKSMFQWAVVSIILSSISFGLFGWYIHDHGQKAGYNSGYGVGYSEAKDEKAAAAWANTPEGEMAYRMAQSGTLYMLAKCTGKGWVISKGFCYPQVVSSKTETTYAWKLP